MTDSSGSQALPLADPSLVATMRWLTLTARQAIKEAGAAHRRPLREGSSQSFREHRAYVPGDDLRHVDWRVFARRGKPYIKTYEDRGRLDVLLAIDAGSSLRFGEGRSHKLRHVASLAYALAATALAQEDCVGLVSLGGPRCILPIVKGYAQQQRIVHALSRLVLAPSCGSARASDWPSSHARRGRLRLVLFSDFLTPLRKPAQTPECDQADPSQLGALLKPLAAAKHVVSVVHVVHPVEQALSYRKPGHFVAPGRDAGSLGDPVADRVPYQRAFARFVASLADHCRLAGADFVSTQAGGPLAPALRQLCRR